MRCAEWVVFAFGPLCESGEAAALTQCANAVTPPGEDFVRIRLVADIPDQPVGRRVKHIVQGDGELDDAKPGAEMAAGPRDRVDGLVAQLVRQLPELVG